MPQTTIGFQPARGLDGQIAETMQPVRSRTYAADGAGVHAGKPVVYGTTPATQVAAIGAATLLTDQNFAGFVMLDTARAQGSDGTTPIADKSDVVVMREGYMFVIVGTGGCTAGQEVVVTLSSGALKGQDKNTLLAAGTALVPGCRFMTTAASGDPAIVEINASGPNGQSQGGTYTPTLTGVTNIAASSVGAAHWRRVGNLVEVDAVINVDPTAGAPTATQIDISLPIASDLAATTDLTGLAASEIYEVGVLVGDATNNRASLFFTTANAAAKDWHVRFSYRVL